MSIMMRLKIVKCDNHTLWYSQKIGQFVECIAEFDDCYLSREDSGFTNTIRKDDAEIVHNFIELCVDAFNLAAGKDANDVEAGVIAVIALVESHMQHICK